MGNGWNRSAEAWIADMGEEGDYSRTHVLDAPMLERVQRYAPQNALDVGCGEGRFCRMMSAQGIETTGIDPTEIFVGSAKSKHPAGTYIKARAEELPFEDESFDLVVTYLSLIDIEGFEGALGEMSRVLRKGGHLLIANLNSFVTALPDGIQNSGWVSNENGEGVQYRVDNYLNQRGSWFQWRGIKVLNYHRPMRDYMSALLGNGLRLCEFDEPAPWRNGGPQKAANEHSRVPFFVIMSWSKD